MSYDKICGIKVNLNNEKIAKYLRKYCWLFIYSKVARKMYRGLPKENWEKNTIITEKILQGYCVCYMPASLGDTLLFYEYKKTIEEYYQIKCFNIVRKTHEIIPVLCGDTEYITVDNFDDIMCLPIVKALYYNANDIFDIGNNSPIVEKQRLYIAHWDYIPSKKHRKPYGSKAKFREAYKDLLGIPEDSIMTETLDISKLTDLPDIKNTILLAPQTSTSSSTNLIPPKFWIAVAKYFNDKGCNVLYNSVNKIEYLNGHAQWINCSLENALKYAIAADKFISCRSGICDLLHSLGEKLAVIYQNREVYNVFNLNEMFNRNDIKELIYQEPFDKLIQRL